MGVPPAILVRSYKACRARQPAATSRPPKLKGLGGGEGLREGAGVCDPWPLAPNLSQIGLKLRQRPQAFGLVHGIGEHGQAQREKNGCEDAQDHYLGAQLHDGSAV